MNQTPITNNTPNPIYVAGKRIEPGETRLFDLTNLPPHLRNLPGAAPEPKQEPDPEPDARLALLDQSIAAFEKQIAARDASGAYLLSAEDLEWLAEAEAAGQNRKGIAEAIDEEVLRRAVEEEEPGAD